MKSFVYTAQPARIIFGAGSLSQLPKELDALGAKKALVLCTPEQRASADMVAGLLGSRAAGVFDRAVMHVPIETAREARELAKKLGADCAVAIGGGSTPAWAKPSRSTPACPSWPSPPPTRAPKSRPSTASPKRA